jgi:uncharacterized protein (UPF0335 family)
MDGSTHIDTALRGYVDRIVNLHQDRDAVNGDIREVYGELKDAGFNVTIVRGMVKEQRMDADARASLYQLQEEYRIKLGLLADTPLGQAAVAASLHVVERPTPFAEQPVHQPRPRGRPRKNASEALDDAESHFRNSDLKPMFNA